MWSSKGRFADTLCPSESACTLPKCMYSHEKPQSADQLAPTTTTTTTATLIDRQRPSQFTTTDDKNAYADETVVPKRRRLNIKGRDDRDLAPSLRDSRSDLPSAGTASRGTPFSATRPVSPPTKGTLALKKSNIPGTLDKPKPRETLVPRDINKAPASYGLRKTYLEALHTEMKRLNADVLRNSDPEMKKLRLTEDSLIKLAVDEEQTFAEGDSSIYKNVIKQRFVALKKMGTSDWVTFRQETIKKENGDVEKRPLMPPIDLETGLAPTEELWLLSHNLTKQTGLDKYGYTTYVPTEEGIQKARDGVTAANGHEECDRCKTRFQVYPDRNADGMPTTGGQCTHHYGKLRYPPKGTRTTSNEQRWSCCQDVSGSEGCTTAPHHVFMVKEPKRLSLVTPFIETPPNPKAPADRAICFDCEMGYTAYGFEMIRLTATSWPTGSCVLDILVKPVGIILDLNTRFSGVTPAQYSNAPAYDSLNPQDLTNSNALVRAESPAKARELFLGLITTTTPLIGHALENDLNVLRLVHPTIVDTVLLYPHPHGLPLRYRLQDLAKRHLKKDIQTAGAAGHDSLEDARTAGELVRLFVKYKWEKMQHSGWKLVDGVFVAPLRTDGREMETETGEPMRHQGERKESGSDRRGAGANATSLKRRREGGGGRGYRGSESTYLDHDGAADAPDEEGSEEEGDVEEH